MMPSGRALSAVADAQRARGVRAYSKAVVFDLAPSQPVCAHGGSSMGGKRGSQNPTTPTEALRFERVNRRVSVANPPITPSTGRPIGEVGNSNTQLYCQIDTPPPTHHCRVL